MSAIDPRDDAIEHSIEQGQVYEDSRNDEELELIYIDGNVYVFQRRDETHRFGSRNEFEDNVQAGRFSLTDTGSFAITERVDGGNERVPFEELDGIGEKAASNLRDAGYETVNDVARASDDELLEIAWVGEKGLNSIREIV
jgi:hypothetical protein